MMFRRIVSAALASTASSFSAGHKMPATTGARTLVTAARSSSLKLVGSKTTRRRRQPGLAMIFGNLFGGGAFNLKIDYSTLDHPGPELAKFAEEGKAPERSERDPHLRLATFAGGCFWGLELAFQRVPGVVETAAGYAQGKEEMPTYEQVCAGATGHTEAVIVYYDPKECSYESLLDAFFERVDPTTVNGQGRDYGKQYRTGIYFHSKAQEKIARERFEAVKTQYKRPIATELKAATPFWPAEKYHQQYLEKGGRFGRPQTAEKGASDTIRCYG
ncbi:Peptide methionine sulfoxide reductase MsrA [Seminavis robusta]|uniref:peptide-methionine (S)-S-oxide reductase n=1 Tax=Seminavis robusta TaxID=568900 RepID=A0A9N8DMC4_9STRA|nr:Peptide methionine sulfoxide reductase MsrA [Seminavis robusta]|eukprot:Sro135_g063680.1 Peptide methionine sulfoxide reductase MsrA (274) ;mRNA; r:21699-22520